MPSINPLDDKFETLAKHAWDDEVRWENIEAWLENFTGEVISKNEERRYALLALTRFMYFSRRMVRVMLRSLYRDHFKSPMIQRIRRNCNDMKDASILNEMYRQELNSTRFLGVGNPSESGTHLLYFFRQVNKLSKDFFVDFSSAFEVRAVRENNLFDVVYSPRELGVHRYVFFDDLVGSGTQAAEYLSQHLAKIRAIAGDRLDIRFMSLFATSEGLKRLNQPNIFDGKAMCLFELDETFRAFGEKTRYFANPPEWFSIDLMRQLATHYGSKIWPDHALGYKDGQLLIGFSHNTPDNTLPVFWYDGNNPPWAAAFLRYHKL